MEKVDPRTGRIMETKIRITRRQFKEIRLALYYAKDPHGTTGHNQLIILAQLASSMGFRLSENNWTVEIPTNFKILDDVK